MTTLPPIHLAVMQPPGYVHSLGFVDQARYFRHQLRRLGAAVTLAKNRLREDALNLIFGAHLGLPPDALTRHPCMIVNLEQLGHGGANLSPDYLNLLRRAAVVDYDPANVAAYCTDPADVPVVPFGPAPYLASGDIVPLEERPIDLLFFGSVNPRRRAFLDRIEAAGVNVAQFDFPLYGEERDHYIRQAKAVVNCHFYETSRFEQARAFHCLSLGTPVISERTAATQPPAAFEEGVFWLRNNAEVDTFFGQAFRTPMYFEAARRKLAAFARHDPIEAYADMLAFAAGFHRAIRESRGSVAWRPTQLNLGSGKDYKPGWLNVDILDRADPDLVLNLAEPIELPISCETRHGGTLQLEAASLDRINANNVLEHVPDLPTLMTNALALLKDGGTLDVEVPYEKSLAAWQDPTHLRAMNENSWIYYTEWFWYLGWFDHRFEVASFQWLNLKLQVCEQAAASFMRVQLRKVPTTPKERTIARAMRADFGGLPDDMPNDTPQDIPQDWSQQPVQDAAPSVLPTADGTAAMLPMQTLSA